jgi:N-acyl-D-amino-acid deacylase
VIARDAGIRAEIYHLKAAGRANWDKIDEVIHARGGRTRGRQRAKRQHVRLHGGRHRPHASMPPWVQEGGQDAWVERLKQPDVRARVVREMRTPSNDWENLLLASGPEGVLLKRIQH